MLSRRYFLKGSALVAFAPVVPAFIPRMAEAAGADRDGRILVVIQMDGGNDGINTIVPFDDDGYGRNRRSLRIGPRELLKLNTHVGVSFAMQDAYDLYNDGRLAIVQGVGYPNPNRSHFESMAIWHTARPKDTNEEQRGWIGRAFDAAPRPKLAETRADPDAIFVGPEVMPKALVGRRINAVAMSRVEDLTLRLPVAPKNTNAPSQREPSGSAAGAPTPDVAAFVRRRVLEAYGTATALADANKSSAAGSEARYPGGELATRLRLISRLIKSGGGTRVFYASQPGYDTHGAQRLQQDRLLGEFSSALKAFLEDLKSNGLDDRVLVMAFSEFGRRVTENDSAGTDHGTAGPVFIAGGRVKAGLVGPTPDLTDLEDGDLKVSTDFRRIYATLLTEWLNAPANEVLGGDFQPMPLIRGA